MSMLFATLSKNKNSLCVHIHPKWWDDSDFGFEKKKTKFNQIQKKKKRKEIGFDIKKIIRLENAQKIKKV